jgi:hypothetical protein
MEISMLTHRARFGVCAIAGDERSASAKAAFFISASRSAFIINDISSNLVGLLASALREKALSSNSLEQGDFWKIPNEVIIYYFIDFDRLSPEFLRSCSGCVSEVTAMPGTAIAAALSLIPRAAVGVLGRTWPEATFGR